MPSRAQNTAVSLYRARDTEETEMNRSVMIWASILFLLAGMYLVAVKDDIAGAVLVIAIVYASFAAFMRKKE